MGIESDQVVYEYLSRVGDVAHQRQLPSGARMRLVSELRNEIDRRRAKTTVDSPAAVRRILDRIGTPDEVVEAADGSAPAGPRPPSTEVPVQRDGEGPRPVRAKGLRRVVPRPRTEKEPAPRPPEPPLPPAAAGLPAADAYPADWWRVDRTPLGDQVEGFVGGIEIPELLRPSLRKETGEERTAREAQAAKDADAGPAVVEAEPETAAVRRRFGVPLPAGNWSNPLLLVAAGLLVVGAVLGNWAALLGGWLIAYLSRRLTQNESKWAVMGMPGLAVTAGAVWLWGRSVGRWGSPIAQGHMNDALAQTWPWVVRGAAVLSALYVLWRSQRKV
ncbi:hypothetical protein ELQ87_21510 [Streptomyces griseoviridis]|uniref:Integral membrane protein n=1 Tax=Streptomyces griseoviridis TaxID=45398 RepID=A0A3S9ZFI8_STRGD|nr:hypothetical protein [Streptomyces griseoviridis]AZS86543.1 hypothetical protein ELQ87_21510 [Streptomyces griseoviridis]QCN86592.1 hypothetical protein DDJ31_17755 [Streptomyces griseoviridis]